jgi:hypothetical protein
MIGEDPLRGSDSPEIIDQPSPHEWVKAEGPDFGDQISTAKLELSVERRLICGSSYFYLFQTTGHHGQGSHRLKVEGPSTKAAVEETDLRRAALRLSSSVESLEA